MTIFTTSIEPIDPTAHSQLEILYISLCRILTMGMIFCFLGILAGLAAILSTSPLRTIEILAFVAFVVFAFLQYLTSRRYAHERVRMIQETREMERHFRTRQEQLENGTAFHTQLYKIVLDKSELSEIPASYSPTLKLSILNKLTYIIGLTHSLSLDVQRKPVYEVNDHDFKEVVVQLCLALNELKTCLGLYPTSEKSDKTATIHALDEAIHELFPILNDWSLFRNDQEEAEETVLSVRQCVEGLYVQVRALLESGQYESQRSW